MKTLTDPKPSYIISEELRDRLHTAVAGGTNDAHLDNVARAIVQELRAAPQAVRLEGVEAIRHDLSHIRDDLSEKRMNAHVHRLNAIIAHLQRLAIPADPTREQLMAAMTALQFGASWARYVDAPNHADVAERLQAGADAILALMEGKVTP